MRRMAPTWLAVVAGGLFVVSCSDSSTPTQPLTSDQPSLQEFANQGTSAQIHVMPTRALTALNEAHGQPGGNGGGKPKTASTGIFYHGGPVLYQTKVVAVYWSSGTIYNGGPGSGTGSGSQDGSLVGFFLRNLGGSSYFNINTTYYDGSNVPVENSVAYTGYWTTGDNPSASTSDGAIKSKLESGFNSGNLSYDPSTLYAVFTGSGVNLGGGFGTQYCAYHGYYTRSNGTVVKYAAMPYVADYPTACNVQTTTPNGDFPADGVINVLAHETEEATTDPQLNAWYDRRGYENADKCAWKFGTVYTASNGSHYNMTIGSKQFLIQMNWVDAGSGGCAVAYP